MGGKKLVNKIFSLYTYTTHKHTQYLRAQRNYTVLDHLTFFFLANYSKIGVTAWDRQAVGTQHTLPPLPDCEGQ